MTEQQPIVDLAMERARGVLAAAWQEYRARGLTSDSDEWEDLVEMLLNHLIRFSDSTASNATILVVPKDNTDLLLAELPVETDRPYSVHYRAGRMSDLGSSGLKFIGFGSPVQPADSRDLLDWVTAEGVGTRSRIRVVLPTVSATFLLV